MVNFELPNIWIRDIIWVRQYISESVLSKTIFSMSVFQKCIFWTCIFKWFLNHFFRKCIFQKSVSRSVFFLGLSFDTLLHTIIWLPFYHAVQNNVQWKEWWALSTEQWAVQLASISYNAVQLQNNTVQWKECWAVHLADRPSHSIPPPGDTVWASTSFAVLPHYTWN